MFASQETYYPLLARKLIIPMAEKGHPRRGEWKLPGSGQYVM